MIFFVDIDGDIQIMLQTLMNFYVGTWISLNDRKSSKDKANMGNYKANRGYFPYTVNRTSAMCSMLTRTLISPYRDEALSYWDVQHYVKQNISSVG